jgi:hypothetical protein
MAAENVQFSVQAEALIGQVNPGYKITRASDGKEIAMPAYLDSVSRADFEFKFVQDKMYVYGEWSQRYSRQLGSYTDTPFARIGYNLSPIQFIEIGSVWIGAPYAYEVDGTSTQPYYWGMEANWCCASTQGIKYNHYLGEMGNLMVGYFTLDDILGGPGTAFNVAWSGSFGPLGVQFGYDSATSLAQPATTDLKDPESLSNTRQYVGVQYKISDAMSVSLNLIMVEVNSLAAYTAALGGLKDEKQSSTTMPIVFKMNDLGPGNLTFMYTTITQTGYASSPTNAYWGAVPWVKDHKFTQTSMNLFYKIPITKQAGVEVVYLDRKFNVEDKDGNKALDSAAGPTTIGGGFYARF